MNRVWADPSGLPTEHSIRAALRVAALIDPQGSPVVDARETYWHVASGGSLPPPDLALGEALLVDLELAVVIDGAFHRTQQLDDLLDSDENFAVVALLVASIHLMPEPPVARIEQALQERIAGCVEDEQQQRDVVAVALSKFDATRRVVVGDIGEAHVLAEVRAELTNAGHDLLARHARRVSLISDSYGYDIVAPRLRGKDRLLEVKSTTSISEDAVTIYVSRHEAEVGRERDNWMLVICHVADLDLRVARTLGWLRFDDVKAQFPANALDGRWESASLTIRLDRLAAGVPSAFL